MNNNEQLSHSYIVINERNNGSHMQSYKGSVDSLNLQDEIASQNLSKQVVSKYFNQECLFQSNFNIGNKSNSSMVNSAVENSRLKL